MRLDPTIPENAEMSSISTDIALSHESDDDLAYSKGGRRK